MGKTHKQKRAEQARAAASAGGSQKAANAAAAAVLEALGAGAGEVCAAAFKRLRPRLTLLAQAVRSDAIDGRLSYLPLRPEHGGGASVRLALWGGHRPAVGPALRLRPPPPGFQLLASFCRLRSHPLRLLAICVGALFHFQVDPTHICARPADFFLGDLCIVETTAGGNSLPEALFIAFEVLAGRGVPSAELTRSIRQAPIVPRLLNTCARTCWRMCSDSIMGAWAGEGCGVSFGLLTPFDAWMDCVSVIVRPASPPSPEPQRDGGKRGTRLRLPCGVSPSTGALRCRCNYVTNEHNVVTMKPGGYSDFFVPVL